MRRIETPEKDLYMKRASLAIILISIVALVFAAGFINLQIQINRLLEEKEYNLTIKNMAIGSWENLGGLNYVRFFNVTIQNDGPGNVGGVTLAFKITGNQTNIQYELMWIEPDQMGVLHAGESKLIRIYQSESLDNIGKFSGCTFVATLMLDNLILDEKTQVI